MQKPPQNDTKNVEHIKNPNENGAYDLNQHHEDSVRNNMHNKEPEKPDPKDTEAYEKLDFTLIII